MRLIRFVQIASIVIGIIVVAAAIALVVHAFTAPTIGVGANVSDSTSVTQTGDITESSDAFLTIDVARITVHLSAASFGLRALTSLGVLLRAAIWVIALSATALISGRLRAGRPFVSSATSAVYLVAASVGLGSVLAQVTLAGAGAMAVHESGLAYGFRPEFDVVPLCAAVGLALLARAFRFGERQQRDVEGLV